jgi:hypothetical protein
MNRHACLLMLLTIVSGVARTAAAEDLPQEVFASKTTGAITAAPSQHSPLYAEFERSPELSRRLAAALSSSGFALTQDKSSAKASLIVRGDIALSGGPVYFKGAKMAIGEATERALASGAGSVTRADLVQAAAGVALNKAALESAITPFWRGLAISGLASALGEATGVKAAFNRATTGDPRGICLSRCEDWNKVSQTVYSSIVLQSGDQRQEVRVLTKVNSEQLVVEQLLDRALSDALAAVHVEAVSGGAAR